MVDVVSVEFSYPGAKNCSATMTEMIKNYQTAVQSVRELKQRYQRPVWLSEMTFDAGGCSLSSGSYTLLTGAGFDNSSPNYAWQSNMIKSMFEVVACNLSKDLEGLAIGTFLPWLEATWARYPRTSADLAFAKFATLGYSLYGNTSAQSTISEYLSNPWGWSARLSCT